MQLEIKVCGNGFLICSSIDYITGKKKQVVKTDARMFNLHVIGFVLPGECIYEKPKKEQRELFKLFKK